jgi:hypothetical protein
MTAPTKIEPELVEMSGHACIRSSRGRGCYPVRWMRCEACGWTSELVDGQPDLLTMAHVCDPADVDRRQRIFGSGGG